MLYGSCALSNLKSKVVMRLSIAIVLVLIVAFNASLINAGGNPKNQQVATTQFQKHISVYNVLLGSSAMALLFFCKQIHANKLPASPLGNRLILWGTYLFFRQVPKYLMSQKNS